MDRSCFVALLVFLSVSLLMPLTAGINISSVDIAPTNNSATINWSSDAPTVYNLTLDTKPITYWDVHNLTIGKENSTTHSKIISGLNGNTTYYYLIVCRSGEEYANESGSFVTKMSPPAAKPFNINDYLFLLIIAVIAICAVMLVSLNKGIRLIFNQSETHHSESIDYYKAVIRTIKVMGGKDVYSGGEGVRNEKIKRYEGKGEEEKYLVLAKGRAEDLRNLVRRLKGIDRYGLTEDIIKILQEEIENMTKSEKANSPVVGIWKAVERIEKQIKHKIQAIEQASPSAAKREVANEMGIAEKEFSEMKRTVEENYMRYHPDIPRHFLNLAKEEIESAKELFDRGDYKSAIDRTGSARKLISYVNALYDVMEHRMLLETLKSLVPPDKEH